MRKWTIAAAVSAIAVLHPAIAAATAWQAKPSLKYDALCLAGVMADDPYQTQFYGPQRAALVARLSPETVAAGARVHRAFKAAGTPTIGWLGLVYSATGAATLEELIAATEQPQAMRARLEPTEYWYPDRWAVYETIRPDLLVYLKGLQSGGFAQWWADNAAPEVDAVLGSLLPRLQQVDFGPYIERALERPAPATVIVHATRFCRPFGARLLGAEFIMDVVGKKDPFRSVGAGAIHEMTHPPFDPKDPRIRDLVAHLERDPVLQARFSARPRDSGYNSFEGYINEDVTRALDQLIGERVGVTFMDDAERRWREQEGGFHVAAAVFYRLMKDEAFLDGRETATEFLDRMRRSGRMAPERIRTIVDQCCSQAQPGAS